MKKILINFCVLFIINTIAAQGGPESDNVQVYNGKEVNQLFIAPEASQLLKVNFIPMNLYTGKLDFQIPLYEVKVGSVSVPVSLRYNSEGIKIEEESSNVGSGWVLQAGGSVNKMIRDLEDRSVYTYDRKVAGQTNPITYLTAYGSLRSYDEFNYLQRHPSFSTDLLPDLFMATAPGLNSKFYFSKDNGIITAKETDNSRNSIALPENLYDKVYNGDLMALAWAGGSNVFPEITNQTQFNKIESYVKDYVFALNWYLDYSNFDIVNTSGVLYKFKTSDVNVDFSRGMTGYVGVGRNEIAGTKNYMNNHYNVNKGTWHLNEIVDPSTNLNVKFEYKSFTTKNLKEHLQYFQGGTVEVPNQGGTVKEEFNDSAENKNYYSFNALYNYVSKISWGEGSVEFYYDTARQDISNKKALSRIVVKGLNSSIIKDYRFVYGYMSMSTAKRLKLERIDVMEGSVQKKLYEFSYYEDTALPGTTSFKTDFIGYYNNSSLADGLAIQNYVPKLYFVRDRKNFSITPFPVTNSIPVPGGVRNIEANNYSSTGLLKSVKNRTGGINEFSYESNVFRFYGQDIMGGGSRIASQTIKEGTEIKRKLNYKYLDLNGNSSGSIANIPKYGKIHMVTTENGKDKYSISASIRLSGNIELTEGAYVGYERVVEEEPGNGYAEYTYTSPRQFPNFYPDISFPVGNYSNRPLDKILKSSFFPADVFIENTNTGKLLTKTVFDNTATMLLKKQNQYLERTTVGKGFSSQKYKGPIQSGTTHMYELHMNILKSDYLLQSEETNEYFNGTSTVNNKMVYTFHNDYNFITKKTSSGSKGETLATEFKYPPDLVNSYEPIQKNYMQMMYNKNMIGNPVIVKNTVNDVVVKENRTLYGIFKDYLNNNLILPIGLLEKKGLNAEYEKISYDKYDFYGNLTQFTLSNGTPVSIIWGYSNQYPVLKVEGAQLSDIVLPEIVQLMIVDGNIGPATFDFLRSSLPDARITNYTYKPLIGISTVTGPGGLTEYYEYDAANRLESIKDHKGKTVKTFKYNYKN